MKTKVLVLLALSSVTMLSADSYGPYGRSSCPGGNCPYQGQGPRQGYYPEASGQAYYQNNPQYRQGPRDQYDQQAQYRQGTRDQYDQQGQYRQGTRDQYDQQGQYRQGTRDQYDQNQPYQSRGQYDSQNGYYNPSSSDSYSDRDNKSASDEDIRKKVDDAIAPSWLSSGYPNVNFNVNNGTVDLRGSVKNQDERSKLEAAIRKIDGVRQVNNQVMVTDSARDDSYMRNDSRNDSRYDSRNDSSMRKAQANYPQDKAATDADRRINSKIRDNITGWFTDGYETITLDTSNGVVTIMGFVESADDLDKISKEAKKVDGVKNVNNKASIQRK